MNSSFFSYYLIKSEKVTSPMSWTSFNLVLTAFRTRTHSWSFHLVWLHHNTFPTVSATERTFNTFHMNQTPTEINLADKSRLAKNHPHLSTHTLVKFLSRGEPMLQGTIDRCRRSTFTSTELDDRLTCSLVKIILIYRRQTFVRRNVNRYINTTCSSLY